MLKRVIYLVNEIKGVTEGLKSNINYNIVRDYRGNGKSFTAVSLSQDTSVPATIVCKNHRFETIQVEVAGGQRRFWTKTSEVIKIVTNLYNRGVETKIINYRGKDKEEFTINLSEELNKQIDEFCGIDKTTSHFGYKDRNGRIVDGFKKADVTKHKISWYDFSNIGVNPYTIFKDKTQFEKALEVFTKNAELYDLDSTSPTDMYTFIWMRNHNHSDFLANDRFKCPHCGNVVHINGHEEFIKGKPVNTGETICEYCGEEFDIHDKRDVVETYYSKIFA